MSLCPARAIVRTAVEEGCELILLATRGGSKVKRWIMGGVTEQVLRMSPIPVLSQAEVNARVEAS